MENKKVLIIAEAGVNHNGNINLAKKLVDVALEAGADIVKFQTFKAERLATKTAKKAEYQVENTGQQESQYEMLKKLELSEDDFMHLNKYAQQKGIRFFSTGFDIESLEFLKTLDMGLWKIPSGEITNLPYLEFMGKTKQEVILSTGMSTMDEVKDAVKVLLVSGTSLDKLTVLHCSTNYPTPYEDVHLRAMLAMQKELGVKVGYSDHTNGLEVSCAAVALGATVIEKHFTLDKNMPGPDHKASLDPAELKTLVTQIRHIEKALGNAIKMPSKTELKNRAVARKSIVASKTIEKGEVFSPANLTVKRPGIGISPMKIKTIYGQISQRKFEADELIEL